MHRNTVSALILTASSCYHPLPQPVCRLGSFGNMVSACKVSLGTGTTAVKHHPTRFTHYLSILEHKRTGMMNKWNGELKLNLMKINNNNSINHNHWKTTAKQARTHHFLNNGIFSFLLDYWHYRPNTMEKITTKQRRIIVQILCAKIMLVFSNTVKPSLSWFGSSPSKYYLVWFVHSGAFHYAWSVTNGLTNIIHHTDLGRTTLSQYSAIQFAHNIQ